MYSVVVHVPESHLEAVKDAVFAAGAGRVGDYDSCCWQVAGEGQFRPLAGSKPFLGETMKIEKVAEWRIEFVSTDEQIHEVVAALKKAHPYEQPSYRVTQVLDI